MKKPRTDLYPFHDGSPAARDAALAASRRDREIHPALALALVLGLVLACWVVVLALVLGALVVAGTVGVVLLFVGAAAIWWGAR